MLVDYVTAKLASMVGGLIGGGAILTFIRPKTIGEAFMRGGLSVGSATIFTVPLLQWFGISNNWENQLMGGFVVGFIAYSVLGMVANFFMRNANRDIVSVVNDIRSGK